jgi:hypothetical protein
MRTASDIPLPTRVEEISAEWLSEALGAEVRRLEIGEILWATATKVYVRVECDEVPERLVVKAGFGKHELTAAMLSFYEGESDFYTYAAPLLNVGLPECYFAGKDAELGTATVVLEDLLPRGVEFLPPAGSVTADVVAKGLERQARWHAATWDAPVLDQFQVFPGAMHKVLLDVAAGEYWASCLAKPRAQKLPELLREPEAFQPAIETLWAETTDETHCLIHGDPHLGNTFVEPDGTPGFIDWQMATRGDWAHDVTYFITSSLIAEDRRASERDLLAHYLEHLSGNGAPVLDYDAAWTSYRRQALHGLFWAANADGMYPEEINVTNVDRFATAAEDHGTLNLLGL